MTLDLESLRGHTPGPWDWVIHDQSMATLGVLPDPGLGDPMVMNVSPCDACDSRVTEWQWGNCGTPKIEDARLIAIAPTLLAEYERLLTELTARRARDAEVEALLNRASDLCLGVVKRDEHAAHNSANLRNDIDKHLQGVRLAAAASSKQ